MNICNFLPLCSDLVPHGYTEVGSVPVARPGRRLYNVRNPGASRSDSVLVQIDATEGNKVITLRSPLQVMLWQPVSLWMCQTEFTHLAGFERSSKTAQAPLII